MEFPSCQTMDCSAQPFTNERSSERRLRVGYISSDFRDHVVGRGIYCRCSGIGIEGGSKFFVITIRALMTP